MLHKDTKDFPKYSMWGINNQKYGKPEMGKQQWSKIKEHHMALSDPGNVIQANPSRSNQIRLYFHKLWYLQFCKTSSAASKASFPL